MNAQSTVAAVRRALEAETRIPTEALSVDQDGDRIVLSGRVDDIAAKRLARNAVWSVVKHEHPIVDQLRVVAHRRSADGGAGLRDAVANTLTTEGMFRNHTLTLSAGDADARLHDAGPDAPHIGVRIDGGVVTLEGTVPSLTHRRFAEVLCWWAPSCERVDNRLRVEPPEEDNDGEITDAVRMVLEKDPLVDATQLRVGSAGGVVELRGLLVSEEQRRLALRDAWYVPGVWTVLDHIDVRPT